jgi:DNA ligase-1
VDVSVATLLEFAQALDTVAATSGKLEKQRRLAGYFKGLSDDDLRRAVRYAAGRAFAATDERVLGASGAAITDAVLDAWSIDYPAYRAAAIARGEIGEAVAELLSPILPPGAEPALTLAELDAGFDRLAATTAPAEKRDVLRRLLGRVVHPREAAYLCKIVLADLRSGAAEGVLQAAVAEAFGAAPNDVRRAQFLLGSLDAVAVLARHGRLGEARFTLFHPVQFMLATPRATSGELVEAFDGRAFVAEDKLDGIRAQVHKEGEGDAARVAIYTRTLDRIDASFPDIAATARRIPGTFLLDGEIVAGAAGSILPFARLQPRLNRKMLSENDLREHPAAFVAFDLLYDADDLLLDLPLTQRRARLEDRLAGSAPVESADPRVLLLPTATVRTEAEIDAAFAAARQRRNEGLVLKDPGSAYAPGRRGQWWFKLKTHLPTIDCVVTAAEYGHGKRRGTLSDYTFAVWDRDPASPGAGLLNIGKAYSGVTDEEIARLTEVFRQIATESNGRVFRVPPRVVLEIAMDQVQRSARHASGFALRFPRVKRIRWDKRPEDADRLDTVKEIFASPENITRKDDAPPAGPAKATRASPVRRPRARPGPTEPTLFDGV